MVLCLSVSFFIFASFGDVRVVPQEALLRTLARYYIGYLPHRSRLYAAALIDPTTST